MSKHRIPVSCVVEIEVNDPDVIERVTGPKGDEWRSYAYDLRTEQEVLEHLAHAAVVAGVDNAKTLDGWADLPKNAVTMRICDVEADAQD
jgi:hypothetical protein